MGTERGHFVCCAWVEALWLLIGISVSPRAQSSCQGGFNFDCTFVKSCLVGRPEKLTG